MDLESRIDLTQVFCDVDDFYKAFKKHASSVPLSGLIAYTYLPRKPSLDLSHKGLLSLPNAIY